MLLSAFVEDSVSFLEYGVKSMSSKVQNINATSGRGHWIHKHQKIYSTPLLRLYPKYPVLTVFVS